MEETNLIALAIALVALICPWLYDGSLFTRQRIWKRKYRTSAYYADRHGEVSCRHRDPIDRDEVRQRAKRRL